MNDSFALKEKNQILGGTLYLVATPIGNISDLSERARKVLFEVDFIAAEDTRNSGKLLSLLGLGGKSMVSYFEHNKAEKGPQILKRLKEGRSCALVTDAGTPAISDPGADLVALCIQEGVPVTAVPGCCAAVNALVLSGLDTRRFLFEGFLEGNDNSRKAALEELASVSRTMIFYEAPHRLRQTLSLMAEIFGQERRVALCREMTKLNEEILRTTLGRAEEFYRTAEPRGEYVLIVEGKSRAEGRFFDSMTVKEHVQFYMDGGMSRMDALKAVAKDRGVGKAQIYKEFLE